MKDSAMGSNKLTISVLLPVYNAENYIRAAVESVLVQTYSDFELIALDDGSTDNSLNILREFEASDTRVSVFTRENRGLIFTLNEMIAKSRGRYLARMDSDDICLAQRFEKQVAFLDSSPNQVAVGGWVEQMNAAGLPIGICRHPLSHGEIDSANLRGHCSIFHPTAMIRREAIIKINGYDENYVHAEDLDLWLRLAETGQISNLPEVLLRYRVHENSISSAYNETQYENTRRICEKACKRRGVQQQFTMPRNTRPENNKASRHEFAVKYGWISWGHNHRETWWSYVCKAFRLRPFAQSTWRLIIFGFFKRPSEKSLQKETDI